MSRGTIHAVDERLFLVEGEWPTEPSRSRPGAAVLLSGSRLYVIDTGTGFEQRSALRAILASFGAPEELVLLNSGQHPGLVGNNDLLDIADTDMRTHLCHRWRGEGAFSAVAQDYPPTRPTSVVGTELATVAQSIEVTSGGELWSGWLLSSDVVAVEVTARTRRLAFFLPERRMLVLPDELALAPAWPGSDVSDVRRMGKAVLELLADGRVEAVAFGFGPPLGAGPARKVIEDLVERVTTVAHYGRDRSRCDRRSQSRYRT